MHGRRALAAWHPRMLEFLDALLRGGKASRDNGSERLRRVARRLRQQLQDTTIDLAGAPGQIDESLQAAHLLIARNVFLEELLALAREAGVEEALLQLSVSNLPVPADALARMLADDPGQPDDIPAAEQAIVVLEDLSLLHRQRDEAAMVHRWTAQGLAQADEEAHRRRCIRAGRYRWWRVAHQTQALDDAIEAVRNFLAGEAFDEAVEVGEACFGALQRFQQSVGIAALASEMLELLPEDHPGHGFIADMEAQAHLWLGATERALSRYETLRSKHQRLAQAEPDRADYQRDLVLSLVRLGVDSTGPEADRHLLQGAAVLRALHESRHLAASNAPMLEAMNAWLAERGLDGRDG